MGKEFTVSTDYEGYVFLGWAQGRFEDDKGELRPYYNMYVLSPVSSYVSDDYEASGMKAEKKKCVSTDVWQGLVPGNRVKLFLCEEERGDGAPLEEKKAPTPPGLGPPQPEAPRANRGAQPTRKISGGPLWTVTSMRM